MNFVEDNGKKVAALLCVASCFPVVATVYAMETRPGWHGDKYINSDTTVAKGWQEIEGKNYYFSEEDGTVDEDATEQAVAASVSSNITVNLKETVTQVSKAAVESEISKQETAPVEEAQPTVEVAAVTPADTYTETLAEETTVTPVVEEVQQPVGEQTPIVEETEQPAEDVQAPVAEEVESPVVDAQPPVVEEIQQPVVEQPPVVEEEQQPIVEQPPVVEEVQQPVVEQPPVVEEVQQPVVDNSYATLNANIAASALQLVGVTDGQWCTEVVQQALAGAGVSDAYQLWPDEYVGQYGYYTNSPDAGNLIYYNNGGRGKDHIAIYIGDGQAVHGNYNGQTVVASAYIDNAGAPQFIQVQR